MPLEYVITGDEVIFEGRPAYSAAVVAGQTVYLAGQTAGRGADGLVIGQGDIELQAETVYRKLGETLARVGATFAHVVKITVYATRAEFRQPLSATRARFLPQPPPASTFVVVTALADPEFLCEVEAVAVLDEAP
jgi:enamine deaminase RidA (YjgF/YER057c/UK114 family)